MTEQNEEMITESEQVTINWRFPRYNALGTIDCEIEHSQFGWIPFTASEDDPEEHGRSIYQTILDSGEQIAPYEPPSPEEILARERATMVVTRRQAKQQLVIKGVYDQIQPAIDAIEDATQRALVQIYFNDADTWERLNDDLITLGHAVGLSDEQMDELFRKAALL